MELTFKTIPFGRRPPSDRALTAYLRTDNWDDFSFKTLFYLIINDNHGVQHEIGNLKIGYFGQEPGSHTQLPDEFTTLSDEFFSLGQDTNYYENLNEIDDELKQLLLNGLNDITNDQNLLNRALDENVTNTSLLRSVSLSSVKGQFKRLLEGGALLTNYNFKFEMPQSRYTAGISLDFSVDPNSEPPSNIHVLIGRNGVGKTHLLHNMVTALIKDEETGEIISNSKFSAIDENWLLENDESIFAGVVSVAFSAFDRFEPYPEQKDKSKGVRYSYVGLKRSTNRGGKKGTPMSHEMLTNEFVNSLMFCFNHGRRDRWEKAVTSLESDPLFKEINILEKFSEIGFEKIEEEATSIFNKMSSGHQIVILTITKLVEKVEEKTLVLIDEPEAHLHPPLLSAFIRSLSDLLSYRNGVAIVATHSPVIVQEVPKICVWKLRRTGRQASAERPEIETFGENVGILTREIFGLEVTESGYHQLLKKAIDEEESIDDVLYHFNWNLGSEAKSILRSLLANRDNSEF